MTTPKAGRVSRPDASVAGHVAHVPRAPFRSLRSIHMKPLSRRTSDSRMNDQAKVVVLAAITLLVWGGLVAVLEHAYTT